MASRAVELALALHLMPSMRQALRERALPADVGHLLKLVGGAPAPLASAAALHGEEPATVLEAARFFVQEVLLFPGADPYRVLGLDASATDTSIKSHYRALQRWLHPDRRGNDHESAYATRVNVAWSHLRSPARRRAYDDSCAAGSMGAQSAMALAAAATPAARVHVRPWGNAAERPVQWKAMLVPLVLLGLCIWLAVLASNDPIPDSERDDDRDRAGGLAFKLNVAAPEPGAEPATAADQPQPISTRAQALALSLAPTRRPPENPRQPRSIAQPEPEPAPTPAPIKPLASQPKIEAPTPKTPTPTPRIALAAAVPPAPSPPRPPAVAATSRPAADPIVAAPIVAKPTAVAPAAAVPTAAASAPSEVLQPAQAVEQRADQLWSYLGGKRALPPPIWRDLAALDAADRIRLRLAKATPAPGQVTFSDPQWQIGDDSAQVRMQVSTTRRVNPVIGTVSARLGWRAGEWWVERLSLEETP